MTTAYRHGRVLWLFYHHNLNKTLNTTFLSIHFQKKRPWSRTEMVKNEWKYKTHPTNTRVKKSNEKAGSKFMDLGNQPQQKRIISEERTAQDEGPLNTKVTI